MPTPTPRRVVLDACVLYPPTLRDTLLQLAEAGLLQPHWSEAILEEVARNLLTAGPTEAQVQHLLGQLRLAFPEALVTGYEARLAEARNHPKDRHVVAAALHASAAAVVTDNLKDFRAEDLPEGLEALSSDEFLLGLFARAPGAVLNVLHAQAKGYRRRLTTVEELLGRLAKRAPRFSSVAAAALKVRTDADVARLHERLDACMERMRVYNSDKESPPLGDAFFAELDEVLTAMSEEFPEFAQAMQVQRSKVGPRVIRSALMLARVAGDETVREGGRDLLRRAGFNPDDPAIERMSDEELMAIVDRNQSSQH